MKKLTTILLFIFTWLLVLCVFLYALLANQKKVVNKTYINLYHNEETVNRVVSATVEVLIYKNDNPRPSGCTAVVFEYKDGLYYLELSAHCVSIPDDQNREVIITANRIVLKIPDSADRSKIYEYPANIVVPGYKTVGDDWAILSAKIDRQIPILNLSKIGPEIGQCVFNVSFPLKADGNLFFGYVSELDVDITAKLVGTRLTEGASGSALASCASGEIFGFVYAGRNEFGELIASTSSRFNEFRKAVKDNKYPFRARYIGEDDVCLIDEECCWN